MNSQGKTPKIIPRNANGFFDPNSTSGGAPVSSKYIRNEETGVYERNYQQQQQDDLARSSSSVSGERQERQMPTRRERDPSNREPSMIARDQYSGSRDVQRPDRAEKRSQRQDRYDDNGRSQTSSTRERPDRSPSAGTRDYAQASRDFPSSRRMLSPENSPRNSPSRSDGYDEMIKGLDEMVTISTSARSRSNSTRTLERPSVTQNLDFGSDMFQANRDGENRREERDAFLKRRDPQDQVIPDRTRPDPRRTARKTSPTLSRVEADIPRTRMGSNEADLSPRSRRLNSNGPPTRTRSDVSDRPPSRTRSRSTRNADQDQDDIFEVPEEEKREFERQKRDLERKKAAERAADKREAEKVAREREKRTMQDGGRRGSAGSAEFTLVSRAPIQEHLLVPDYLTALMTTLRQDETASALPEDFLDRGAYASWRKDMRRTFQEVLIKMIKYRYLVPPVPKTGFEPIQIVFRVIEASGLIAKEGRSRNPYCKIEFGDLALNTKKKRDIYETEVVTGSVEPFWDQPLPLEIVDLSASIQLQVFDKSKEQFLGQIILPMSELITKCAKSFDGTMQVWMDLEPRDLKNKDKYVGGRILVGARVPPEDRKSTGKSYQEIQNELRKRLVDNRALFDILLRACLVLDLFTPREGRLEVLSPEAVSMLKSWGHTWKIPEAYQVISYLKILFEKYKIDAISISDLLKAFHFLYASVKGNIQFSSIEMNLALDLLEKMKEHCSNRVIKYKELFPKNRPNGALESTILVLRMVHRFPTFRERHKDVQESYREELRIMMTEACISKFQRFKELSTPLDENDVESVIDGINKLADLVNLELEQDVQYFQPAFSQELDIVRLTAENQLKYFTLVLEDGGDVLGGDAAVSEASHHVFQLYKTLRLMAERYAKSVEGLTTMTTSYIEGWFSSFMYKWLDQLSKKTIVWVEQAVRADTFIPDGNDGTGVPLHSSSITDVFSAIYSELEFITDLNWSDPVQNAQFFQAFAKTVNTAIEQYCDAISTSEKKVASSAVTDFTMNFLGRNGNEPKDIEAESCAKLRNIAFSLTKLREMYRMMNVTQTKRDRRPTTASDYVTGAFKIHVSYAENIKPTLKNGSSNPYLIVRVPEGTVVPPIEIHKQSMSSTSEAPPPASQTILTGNGCELFRSQVINETLNPTWDETHSVILPPIERLDVAIFSKNLLTADEVGGTAIIDLSVGTRLRRKLVDHQTHDIYVELEPQGRVLLRLTMEGEEVDIDFWFRKTNERLIRTRDFFLRSLTAKITPYSTRILTKSFKDNEAAPLPANNYFSSLISTVQYSDKTATGFSVTQPVQESEAVSALNPLVEYLEKNLGTLCNQLTPLMAQAVIERIWVDLITTITNCVVPPLFGISAQKHFSIRQSSMAQMCLMILRDFMHGDGGEFGLPYSTLDSQAYIDLVELFKVYHIGIIKTRREYELSLLGGKDKELILRLVHLMSEKDSDDSKWIENQLVKRRDQSRK